MIPQSSYQTPGAPGYPAALAQAMGGRAMPLWIRGELVEGTRVAIVGARRATSEGQALAGALAGALAERGITVVSGGAYGIDAAAHRGALAAGGRTVAVLGTGLDVAYPERHHELFEQVATAGALVTSFPAGTPPRRGNFLARNAIISGLSHVVVVIEAELRSGSLTTARRAQLQHRLVGAVPGSPGAAWLLARGAFPVHGVDDVQRALAGATDASEPALAEGSLEARLWAALPARGGTDAEDLADAVGLPVRAVLRTLTNLELSGLVVVAPGRRYLRTASPSAHIARGSCGQYPN